MKRGHTVDLIFALVLVLVFAICLLLALGSGATSYKSIAGTLESHYQERSGLSYIASKFHHYDTAGAVEISRFGESDALCLLEEIDGLPYITRIYYYEGKILELFCAAELELSPDAGEEIIAAQGLELEDLGDGLIRAVCTGAGGSRAEIFLASRSAGRGLGA